MSIDTAIPRAKSYMGQKLLSSQAFWVTIAVFLIPIGLTLVEPSFRDAFWKSSNYFNIMRNFSLIAIIALGQVAVIVTGGIDLSVGSIIGVVGIVLGFLMDAGYSFWFSAAVALLAGVVLGAINGVLIAYVKLSAFVVTLGMMSIGRSLALAISNNKFFHQLGPDETLLTSIGGGKVLAFGAFVGIPNPFVFLVVLTLIVGFLLRYTTWGRHVYAVGGNEQAARLTGVPVDRIKLSVYVLSALMAGISAIFWVGWLGSVTNAIGDDAELRVIASTVIGGANLMGGEGTAYGAFIGAALIEVIRNSLLLAGVDPYWQGTFVGIFIILAVLLERIRGRKVN
jgi:ribose transport system permease protein